MTDGSGFGKNTVIFAVDNSFFVHADNEKMISWFLAKVQRKNISDEKTKFCLNLYCKGIISVLFVGGVKIYQFKGTDFEANWYPLYLDNFRNYFTVDNMKKN